MRQSKKPGSQADRKTSSTRDADNMQLTQRQIWKRRLAVAFVGFHIFVIYLFALPLKSPLAMGLRSLFAPYMRCIGMTESWDMFAPDPKAVEQSLEGVVVTKSGQTRIYQFPRMENLSFWERYRDERYRKFTESILCGDCSGLWPDIEKAIARREADPSDPPEKVTLIKVQSFVDPKTGSVGDDAAAKPTALSELSIQPEDLR